MKCSPFGSGHKIVLCGNFPAQFFGDVATSLALEALCVGPSVFSGREATKDKKNVIAQRIRFKVQNDRASTSLSDDLVFVTTAVD